MRHALIALIALAFIGHAFGQDLTQRQIRDPRKFGAVWNAAAGSVGAVNGATVSASDTSGFINKTVLTLDDTPIVIAEGGSGTNGYGGTKIYDFPEGRILVMGVTVDSFTTTVDARVLDNADGGDFAFGTAVGSAGSLSGAMVDLCPSTSIDPLTNVVSVALSASAQFDGTSTAKDVYVNMTVDDADIASAATNTVDATVTINWINLGDY